VRSLKKDLSFLITCFLITVIFSSIVFALNKDVPYENKKGKVIFSHKTHTETNKLACKDCHPKIFPKMKAGANLIKMAELYKGKYCAVCHTGKAKQAFAVSSCAKCHKGKV
jgi:c(7)-type cytochrome triheme protein